MEQRKPWQFYLILGVAILTLYNILPTIFFYSKPLQEPIKQDRAIEVAQSIGERVDQLESDSIAWVKDFSRNLKLTPKAVYIDKETPSKITVEFATDKEASTFRAFLPQAGELISFVPSQLTLGEVSAENPNTVHLIRKVSTHIGPEAIAQQFSFIEKFDSEGKPTAAYRQLTYDRIHVLLEDMGKNSLPRKVLGVIAANPKNSNTDEAAAELARSLVSLEKTFGFDAPLTQRYLASFTYGSGSEGANLISAYLSKLDQLQTILKTEQDKLQKELSQAKEKGTLVDPTLEKTIARDRELSQTLTQAASIIKKAEGLLTKSSEQTQAQSAALIAKLEQQPASNIQELSLEGNNPYISALKINWIDDQLTFALYPDLMELRSNSAQGEKAARTREQANHLVIEEMARLSRETDEKITPDGAGNFAIRLASLTGSRSLLTFDLGYLAQSISNDLVAQIQEQWHPSHPDLKKENYPLYLGNDYSKLSLSEQRLGLVVASSAMGDVKQLPNLRPGSIYVIGRGLVDILEKYRDNPNDPQAKQFMEDFQSLGLLLQSYGFTGAPGAIYGLGNEYARDYVFELDNFYLNFLKATREDFQTYGEKKKAVLEFTNVEQRILAENRIDDQVHESLLKWKEDYQAAQVSLDPVQKLLVPPPIHNVYWDNLKLNAVKYFRGDDRKVLRWGLDLSGGKTVRIGLRDKDGAIVTNPEEINQAVNELYNRINKMGVAERSIRVENQHIILEFPGSQGFSASELIKASAMTFNIVNEKFTPENKENRQLATAVTTFLQEVWNEASVTNQKDSEAIHAIAWSMLGGNEDGLPQPRSEAAQTLYNNGLRLADPTALNSTSAFNDRVSRVTRYRGDDRGEWYGQLHPLLIVMNNYTLEGSSLDNVQAGYDPHEGNLLIFSVARSYSGQQTGSPRDDFYNWTSQFAQDRIAGTPREQVTAGRGWRLAVVLNGEVVSSPFLKSALRDGGNITGRFTQREINRLVADLKAGSLSYTPKILSEHNVSPELGYSERMHGIVAAIIGFVSVVALMVYVYHFAGVVASVALVFNLLIMWGVLQNIGAALSLPGIAAIVLTMGMAVDANVLVFERTREEYALTGKVASALQAGYKKAFTAIVDSNLTTILAALILIQFDSGPIKGFAVTLIIGIAASMFTALFVTRYYFAGWVKGKNRTLTMRPLFGKTNFDFLKYSKTAVICTVIALMIGGALFYHQRNTLFGMDFTGGYSLTVNVQEAPNESDYADKAYDALVAAGGNPAGIQIRTLGNANQLRIQLGMGWEQPGQPFHELPQELNGDNFGYEWQKNPRITWVVDALQKGGLTIPQSELAGLDGNWSAMSGQFSDTMRNNALLALGAALLSILIYITFRFEFKYAISAVIGLVHDVFLTLGILAALNWLGLAVQIDLQVVGAVMTVIGYSLNNTIIIFDRVREDLKLYRKLTFGEVINRSLNDTLNRTMMTSTTVLVVLFVLVLLGGHSIFTFSLVMTIGIIIGTVSSLFIATPALLFFHNREVERQHRAELKA